MYAVSVESLSTSYLLLPEYKGPFATCLSVMCVQGGRVANFDCTFIEASLASPQPNRLIRAKCVRYMCPGWNTQQKLLSRPGKFVRQFHNLDQLHLLITWAITANYLVCNFRGPFRCPENQLNWSTTQTTIK